MTALSHDLWCDLLAKKAATMPDQMSRDLAQFALDLLELAGEDPAVIQYLTMRVAKMPWKDT